ncbi:hypothetical protein Taro_006552 [Colocasia esculenta]|uniref:Uncharacterized protein n=1 Tax=Colocasia esculenta TaxID=4460 RepID=A0A843TSR6_COLES|nr:hypothetical protein [Colocasia esculenta]
MMESLVSKIKEGISSLSSPSSPSLVSSSAYDTAWVAMVPDSDHPGRPMFPRCLHWICRNQRPGGYWGQTNHRGLPTLDSLTATVACLAALKTWDAAYPQSIEQGLDFLHSSTAELLATHCNNGTGVPRWFAIVFPGMLEVAESLGLDVFRGDFFQEVEGVFEQRRQILVEKGQLGGDPSHGEHCYFPLASYLEVLPAEFVGFDCGGIVASNQADDGSLFQSPSATAFAFMATGDERCRAYLDALVAESSLGVASRGVGVPAAYPVDEQLPKLIMVDTLERLGITEHFVEEVADMMRCIHR